MQGLEPWFSEEFYQPGRSVSKSDVLTTRLHRQQGYSARTKIAHQCFHPAPNPATRLPYPFHHSWAYFDPMALYSYAPFGFNIMKRVKQWG